MARGDDEGGIEIAQDLGFQRRSWKVQRVGWTVMVLVAAAGLLGVFGDGPLSSARAGSVSSGLTVEYERFTRAGAQHAVDFEIGGRRVEGDSIIRLWIDRDWLSANRVVEMTPEPARSEILADRIVYTFEVGQSLLPVNVRLGLESRSFGSFKGLAGIVNGVSVSFRQLAYP